MKKILGSGITSVEGTWNFDKNVAKLFDKHVNQSVPHYKDMQDHIVSLSEWFLKENSVVYDLGCSTGETIKKICNLNISTNFKIIGYDKSSKMIELAKKKISLTNFNFSSKKIVELKCHDVLNIKKFKKSNLFISILLFPFLNYEQRKKLLKKIYSALIPGGAFICVEKIRAKNSNFEDILNQMYFDFKIKNKLNEKQILNKARSLRSSMYLFDEKTIFSLLNNSKFINTETFFKCFNFMGYIAIK